MKMTTRSNAVKIAKTYLGAEKGSKKHKKLVDTFNKKNPHGEVANYTCDWCAITWTAWMLLAGLNDKEAPMSYNCGTLVSDAIKLGCWKEDDNYKPAAGDGIIYNWSDNGVGDCKTGASHVGMVVSVSGSTIKVIEGNYSTTDKVAYRTIKRNQIYIRGYIVPKYATAGARMIAAKAKELAWAKGTAKKKYAWSTGKPTSKYKAAFKEYLSGKKDISGCNQFVAVVLKSLGYKMHSSNWDKIFDYFKDQFKSIKYDKSKLVAGDVVIGKLASGGYHIMIIGKIDGKRVIIEAQQRKTWAHINTSLSKLDKYTKHWVYRAK